MPPRGPLEVAHTLPVPVGHPRRVVILERADQPDLLTEYVQPVVHVPADALLPVNGRVAEVDRHGSGLGGGAHDGVRHEDHVAPAQHAFGRDQVISG
jgi:hypothetical protein